MSMTLQIIYFNFIAEAHADLLEVDSLHKEFEFMLNKHMMWGQTYESTTYSEVGIQNSLQKDLPYSKPCPIPF